jgi:Fe-S cluster biogenesis protein NfuA
MTSNATSSKPAPTPGVYERVAKVLNLIRPAIQDDGGDVELVEVTKDGIARVRLHGACVGCPSSSMTLQMGIERNVRERVPEIVAVEQVH